MNKKDKQINFRISERDKEKIEYLAFKAGFESVGDYLISKTLKKSDDIQPDSLKPTYYCISFNPAIQLIIKGKNFKEGEVVNPNNQMYRVGAKPINIGILIDDFGENSVVAHYSGGFGGKLLSKELTKKSIPNVKIESNHDVRINLDIEAECKCSKMTFGAQKLSIKAKNKFRSIVNSMKSKDYFIFAGSYHSDDQQFIIELLEMCKEKNIKVTCNIDNIFFKQILKYDNEILFPKTELVSQLYNDGNKIDTIEKGKECLRKMVEDGAKNVVFRMPDEPGFITALIATENGNVYVAKTKIIGKEYPGATMEAFIATWLVRGHYELIERIKWSTAFAVAKTYITDLPSYNDAARMYNFITVEELE